MLLEDGLLFSGDHIFSGSTTVIDSPDGDMNAYLDSLDALSAACTEHQIKFILPAHGHVIGGPDNEAAAAIAHIEANLSLNDSLELVSAGEGRTLGAHTLRFLKSPPTSAPPPPCIALLDDLVRVAIKGIAKLNLPTVDQGRLLRSMGWATGSDRLPTFRFPDGRRSTWK